MPKTSTEINIFIAFASKDEKYLDELVKFLSILKVTIWHTGKLLPGSEFADITTERLAQADIILPLLSADFLALDFDLQIEKHKKAEALVIPVILRYCGWLKTYYAKCSPLPADKLPVTRNIGEETAELAQDKYFNEITETLQAIVDKMLLPGPEPGAVPEALMATTVKPQEPENLLYGEKLYLLCDRYPQSTNFSEQLESIIQRTERKPLCFVVVGDYPEQHSSLIERFANQYLWPLFKEHKTPIENLIIPKYVMESLEVGKMNIRRKLAEKVLPLKGHQITATDILDTKTGYNVLLIQHNIMSADWNSSTNELIKWYLKEFWNVSLVQMQHPHVFIFLNVIHSEKQASKGLFGGLFGKSTLPLKQLKELAQELKTDYYVLDELKPVDQDDVRQWFLDYANALKLDETSIMDELYELPKVQTQAMKKVEQTLKTAIEKTLKL